MHSVRFSLTLALGTVLFPLATASPVVAQESDGGHCPGKLEALNRSYVQQLREIERHWIADLADLTDGSSGCGADAAYRQLFNLAIEHDLCQEAEAAARSYLSSSPSGSARRAAQNCPSSIPTEQDLRALAATVEVFAQAEKGEYSQSLARLEPLFKTPDGGAQAAAESNAASALTVGEAYLQRLIRSGRYDVGHKLCELACKGDAPPALKSHFEARMARIDLLDKPAPAISGTDVDGQQVTLADLTGKVVLVEFRQPWCSRCLASFTASNGLAQRYQRQGLVFLGVNVDHGYPDVSEAKTALPAAGRFYFSPGVHWINLLDCQTTRKVTTAYDVEEHPAKFLIGRDGSVVAVEQSGDALERAIVRALGDPTGGHSRGSISRFNEASEFCSSDR
jgi:peroxiredoxin